MADGFEARLYALVDDNEGPGRIDAFKALGDAAHIFADLGPQADVDGVLDGLMDLMQAFGVAPIPVDSLPKVWSMKRFKTRTVRDFTVGELKHIVTTRQWPEDATP